jgi:hypothetical protein
MSSTKPPCHFWLKKRKSQVQHVQEVQFRLQNCLNLQQSSWLHTESDWDVLALHGKLIKYTFQRIQPHPHISSELATIVILVPRPFLSTGAVTSNFSQWTMHHVGSIMTMS